MRLSAVTGGLLLGGSTTLLLNLGRALHKRGDELEVVCMSGENEMAADFAASGVAVHGIAGRRLIYEDRLAAAYRLVAKQQPAAVLAWLGSESFEILRLLPRHVVRLGVIHSDDPGPYAMARHYAPWLEGMVGVSETICRNLRADAAFAGCRIECPPSGIDFGPAVVRMARNPDQPVRIIYVGRMIETQKRISRLVELARLMRARGERFELTFAGSGPALGEAKAALGELANVRFLGEIRNAEIGALLRSQDVFVLLSDYEGLPVSLLEAMGQGVVPVVSDLESGMREVVGPETGIVAPVGDVGAAADAIALLAREPARLAALSAAGSQLVRSRHSATRMAGEYVKLAQEMSTGEAVWPASARIPTPLLVKRPWLYHGLARHARRVLKRIASARR